MSENETARREARDLLRGWMDEKRQRFTTVHDCACGEKVIVTNTPGQSLVAWMAKERDAALVEANESAACPGCGASLVADWETALEQAFGGFGLAIEGALDQMEADGTLAVRLEELRADAQTRRAGAVIFSG